MCVGEFANNSKDKQIEENLRCLVAKRLAVAAGALKWVTKRLEVVDDSPALLSDFLFPDMANIENRYLAEAKPAERVSKEPFSIHAFDRSVGNQVRFWGILYGKQHEKVRLEALDFLSMIRDDTPDSFCVNLLVMSWEEMTRDYVDKTIEGVRRLGRLGHAGDKQADLYRAAMAVVGGPNTPILRYPDTSDM